MSETAPEAWSTEVPGATSWRTPGDETPVTLPPLRIQTERLVLRCWQREDAPLLKAAIDASLEHLRVWMPWAMNEPSELHVVQERLERYRRQFLEGESFVYGVFDRTETEVVGGSGLMGRIGPRALEIGYWVHVDRVGQGLATESTAALTTVGLAIPGVDRLEIRCDPANAASATIPKKLGYRLRETVTDEEITPEGHARNTLIFEMTSSAMQDPDVRLR